MPALAVIIPLFNHAAFIGATLDSVYAQTSSAQRVIIIDDGSTDDSFETARRLARANTEVIRQENRGAHFAINRGVKMAEGCELVAVLNSDDVWHPDRLLRCEQELARLPQIAAVCTKLHLIDSSGTALPSDSSKVKRQQKIWHLLEKENDPLLSLAVSNYAKTTSNLVARRDYVLLNPFSDYKYVHDYHFFLAAALSDNLAVLTEDLLGYRVHETNTIKADGRRAVVNETVQMHLDLWGTLSPKLAESPRMRSRLRLYMQRLFGNYTDFRGELFIQVVANALANQPDIFSAFTLGDFEEFDNKSEPLPQS